MLVLYQALSSKKGVGPVYVRFYVFLKKHRIEAESSGYGE
jgi:hypothetical protein